MTQLQYNIIVKCIRVGAGALADELIPAFDEVVKFYADAHKPEEKKTKKESN